MNGERANQDDGWPNEAYGIWQNVANDAREKSASHTSDGIDGETQLAKNRQEDSSAEKMEKSIDDDAGIDIQKLADSLSNIDKIRYLSRLYRRGAKIDIMQLIEDTPEEKIVWFADNKNMVSAVVGYGGISALDKIRDKIEPEYEYLLLDNSADALENYGLTEEEQEEREATLDSLEFLSNISQYNIDIDKNGNYYQQKVAEDGRYYDVYDSEEVKRLVELQKDNNFFKNLLKYTAGKPEWSEGSKYDDWKKGYNREKISGIINSYATEDVINDPGFIELFAQGYSYPPNDSLDILTNTILCQKMSPSNADKILRRCKQNGVKIEDYVIKAIYGPNGMPDDENGEDEEEPDTDRITEADIEFIKENNFNNVDVGFNLDATIDPRSDDKINYYLKDFCDIDGFANAWEKADERDKEIIATRTAHFIAERIGIKRKVAVKAVQLENGTLGLCSLGHIVKIDPTQNWNSFQAIETIAHEVWHVYQHECADEQDTEAAKIYQKNFKNYTQAENDFIGYRTQPVEEEARRFAAMFRKYILDLERELKK